MKQQFKQFNFRETTLSVIRKANTIITEYQSNGYDLTLRQLYYQFVARDLIDNNQREYNKLGTAVNNGRLAGLIDWSAIKDRTRSVKQNSHWDNPSDIIDSCAKCFAMDTRQDQDFYIETWVEKEALAGVVERICNTLDIPWFACRGFISQSAAHEAAMRCKKMQKKQVIVLHLGDHDPSGIDMTRDNSDRFAMFDVDVTVKRIALNMDQVDEFNPPPNYAKQTDSRFAGYAEKYGDQSWELDALDPKTLSDIISLHVEKYTDNKKLLAMIELENFYKTTLERASCRWDEVEHFLEYD